MMWRKYLNRVISFREGMSLTPTRFRQLEVFRAVMHHGSVGRAGLQLGLTQPAISKLLSALEHDTHVALFDRSNRRLVPTHEARRLAADVHQLFDAAGRLDRAMLSLRAGEGGELRVAAMPIFGADLIPRALARFARQHSRLRVSLMVASSAEVHDAVVADLADLGFALPLTVRGPGVLAPTILLPSLVALPLDHPLAANPTLDMRSLDGEKMVALGRHYRLRDLVEEMFVKAQIFPITVAETQNATAACAMVAEGLGFAVIDSVTARMFAGQVALRELGEPVFFPVDVLAPPGRPMATLAAQFLTALQPDVVAVSPLQANAKPQ